MKIYLSVDMEGVNGVVLKEHVDPQAKEYSLAREWMLQEVHAAIAGAVAGGAEQVLVNDAHNTMTNLPLDRLPEKAHLCTGPMKPFSMMQDLDDSFQAVFLLGYHAMYGTANAVHDHIFAYSMFEKVEINGRRIGELGLNAGLAGHFQVPVVLVTGDLAVAAEAKALISDVETVVVKEGRGRYAALCYPFQETLTAIQHGAQQAVQRAKSINALRFSEPLQLTVTYLKAESADLGALLPEAKRLDGRTLQVEAANYPEMYRKFLALYRLARG